jgi:hypothetical protein
VQLDVQGVKHGEVLAILRNEAANAAHYLVLDACRNTLKGARGAKGFVPIGKQNGVLVAFATEPDKTASDTGSGSGPYAAALAAEPEAWPERPSHLRTGQYPRETPR